MQLDKVPENDSTVVSLPSTVLWVDVIVLPVKLQVSVSVHILEVHVAVSYNIP